MVPATKQPGHPLAGKGISPVHPQTAGTYCPWKPQISITLKGELGGPNSMAGRDIVAADPAPAAAAEEEGESEEESLKQKTLHRHLAQYSTQQSGWQALKQAGQMAMSWAGHQM